MTRKHVVLGNVFLYDDICYQQYLHLFKILSDLTQSRAKIKKNILHHKTLAGSCGLVCFVKHWGWLAGVHWARFVFVVVSWLVTHRPCYFSPFRVKKLFWKTGMRAHGGNEASGGIAVHSGWCGAFPET